MGLMPHDNLDPHDDGRCRCEACGAPADPHGDLCRGCGHIVCAACADANDHWGKGEHGLTAPPAAK